MIQSFEYTYELAWNTIKDYFESQGETNILGGRDTFRLAFRRGLIENGDVWMEMISSRALTSHTYHEETADKIAEDIVAKYYDEFTTLHGKFAALKEKET